MKRETNRQRESVALEQEKLNEYIIDVRNMKKKLGKKCSDFATLLWEQRATVDR